MWHGLLRNAFGQRPPQGVVRGLQKGSGDAMWRFGQALTRSPSGQAKLGRQLARGGGVMRGSPYSRERWAAFQRKYAPGTVRRVPTTPALGGAPQREVAAQAPLQWSMQADQQRANALADYRGSDGSVDERERAAQQEYGVDDQSNPFSRQAMLRRSYDRSRLGNVTSMASQGQLYSGALQRQQDDIRSGFARDTDQLMRGYQGVLRGFADERLRARREYEDRMADADRLQTQQSVASRPDVAPAPAPAQPAPRPAPKPAPRPAPRPAPKPRPASRPAPQHRKPATPARRGR